MGVVGRERTWVISAAEFRVRIALERPRARYGMSFPTQNILNETAKVSLEAYLEGPEYVLVAAAIVPMSV